MYSSGIHEPPAAASTTNSMAVKMAKMMMAPESTFLVGNCLMSGAMMMDPTHTAWPD